MKYYITLFFLSTLFYIKVNAQGCVAIRSNGSTCTMISSHDQNHSATGWNAALNNRYFRSYKHFVGQEEQKERVEGGTEVINYTFSTEFSITRQFNSRWSSSIYIPVINNKRSSKYEHYGNTNTSPDARRNTKSFGLGDIRIAAYRWLLPEKFKKGNVQFGLGLKLPTGDYRYQDYFYRNDTTSFLGPVDQSIQLGDGGTGITAEINSYYHLTSKASLYANGFYLINPREQNGVSTARGGTPSAASVKYGSNVMSVPDQYMIRTGGQFSFNNLSVAAGLRMECVPVNDLVGGSNGFRRPGYVISAEPVVAYKAKKTHFYVSVPYSLVRNRTQSVPDKIRTNVTGTYFKGDAAFADYSINVGASFQLH